MNHPVDEFVASFVGVETILTGKVKREWGNFYRFGFGKEIEAVGEVHWGKTVVLCIRPENVTLSTNPSRKRRAPGMSFRERS